MLNVAGLSVPGISGVDLEKYYLLDQVEFGEEFIVGINISTTIADLLFSKSRLMNLDFQRACLSPLLPLLNTYNSKDSVSWQ